MFGNKKTVLHLCSPKAQGKREFSSVGSEHLPYKQRVGGSNPSTPTRVFEKSKTFFVSKNLHLLYKQRVGAVRRLASNPSTPTKASEKSEAFLCIFVKNIGRKFEAKRRTALNSH